MIENIEATKALIQTKLESVRPYLREDNGDIEFVSLTEDGIVEVRFLGDCATCSLSIMTLRAGIERVLLTSIPGLVRIEAV